MKQKNINFFILAFPLIAFVLLGLLVFIERTGVIYGKQNNTLTLLGPASIPKASNYQEKTPECLVLYSSSEQYWEGYFQEVRNTMESMRVRCDYFDVSSQDGKNSTVGYNLNKYQTVMVTLRYIYSNEQFVELLQWMETGGRLLISRTPRLTPAFLMNTSKLGIQTVTGEEIVVYGIIFKTDLFPGSKNIKFSSDDTFRHNSIPVGLNKNAIVHLTSSDNESMPLLWEYPLGRGRIVFINSSVFDMKDSRGIIAAAYSLLQDAFVYPVINTSLYFLDDFPAPLPEGNDPEFYSEYDMNNRDFFIKVWWPETYALAKDYGLKYTAVLMETYNYNTNPPFEQFSNLDDFRQMGGLLLKSGGQLGLHGYNHVPLCLEADGANQIYGYPSWQSVSAMQGAMVELDKFARTLYPGRKFSVYVPASNVLCTDMRRKLPETLPEINIISSVYLPAEDEKPYVQEFTEASDGIIELPRISSGYHLIDYWKWVIISEINLHYAISHFIHPDDVLDDLRSEKKTWRQLKGSFEENIQWLINSTPGMRQMTADDGAAAVQRYSRLKVDSRFEQGSYVVRLGNFYDEAWLMLRSSKKPSKITGGTITSVTSTLYLIHALDTEIRIDY